MKLDTIKRRIKEANTSEGNREYLLNRVRYANETRSFGSNDNFESALNDAILDSDRNARDKILMDKFFVKKYPNFKLKNKFQMVTDTERIREIEYVEYQLDFYRKRLRELRKKPKKLSNKF